MAQAGTAYIDFQGRYDKLYRQTDQALARIGNQGQATTRALSAGINAAAVGFTVAAGAAAVVVTNVARTGVEYNTLNQRARAAMTTVLGSQEASAKMMDQVTEFARSSPFPRQVFIEATQQMLAFGISAERVVPTLGAIQDAVAASGGGAQQIKEVVYVLSQIQSSGKITATDLMQLGQRGIDAAGLIGDSLGQTGEQVRESITAGTLDADAAVQALTDGMSAKFGGAAENVKSTWIGSVDRIKGATRDIGSAIVEPFISVAGGGFAVTWANSIADALWKVKDITTPLVALIVDRFEPALERVAPLLQGIADRVAGVDTSNMAGLVDKFAEFAPVIATVSGALLAIGSRNIGNALGPLGAILPTINPLLAAFVGLALANEDVRDALGELAGVAMGAFGDAMAAIAPVLPPLVDAFGALAIALIEGITPILPVLADLLILVVPPLVSLLTTALEFVAGVPPEAISAIVGAFLGFQAAMTAIRGVQSAIAGVKLVWSSLSLLMAANPFVLAIAAIAAIGAGLYIAYREIEPFREAVDEAWQSVQVFVDQVMGFLGPFLPALEKFGRAWLDYVLTPIKTVISVVQKLMKGDFLGAFRDIVTMVPKMLLKLGKVIWTGIQALGPMIWEGVKILVPALLSWLGDVLPKVPGLLWGMVTALLGWVVSAVPVVLRTVAGLVAPLLSWIGGALAKVPGLLLGLLTAVLSWVASTIPQLAIAFAKFVPVALGWLVKLLVSIPLKLAELALKLLNWILTTAVNLGIWFATHFLPAALAWVTDAIVGLPGKLRGIWDAIWNWVITTAPLVREKVVDLATSFFGWITDVVTGLPEKLGAIWTAISDWIVGLPALIAETATVIYDAFVDIGTSMLEGIGAGIVAAVEWIGDVAESIWDAIWGFLLENVFQPIADFEISIGPYDAKPFKSLLELLGVEGLAAGGYFNRATPAIIGEAGPELVLPLSDPKRMAALLARYAPTAPVAAAAGMAVAPAPGGAAEGIGLRWEPDLTAFLAWADAIVARMALLPGEIALATAPLAYWEAGILALLARLRLALDAWIANALLIFRTWATLTLAAQTLPGLRIWAGQVQGVFSTMAAEVATILTNAGTNWSAIADVAATRVGTAITTKLGNATAVIVEVVRGYATSLADGLNPILSAIGQQAIQLRNGAIAYAAGGINARGERHVAQIAPAGAWRVWAEPETGGEAYIPLAGSKRGRSKAITEAVVNRFGGTVDWFAGGGITGPTQGLDPRFLARIAQWSAAVGQTFHIGSGWRSVARQAELYASYLAGTGNLAARPGSSMHNFGLAIDGPHWGNRNPGAFGLTYRVPGEPWHVEPIEAREWAAGLPGDAFAFAALPEPPEMPFTGAVSSTASKAMQHVYDKAVEWAATSLASWADTAPTPGGDVSSGPAVEIGQRMAASRGWTGPQWDALNKLWTKESGWRVNADNPTSSAYGIPQALPGSKMASHGADWRTNAATQIAWGLDYIAGRYGTPAAAWAHSQRVNWYRRGGLAFVHRHDFDRGGVLRPGANLVQNNTGANETLVPAGSRGAAAVSIGEAHFHEGVDYDVFLRKTAFMAQAGRI